MGKFSIGAYYMEYITTGRLTIGKDGVPVTSPIERGQVYHFIAEEALDEVRSLTPIAPENIRANTAYLRLFQAPKQVFDADGELVRPKFTALGLFEVADVSAKARGHLQDFCPTLPEACFPFFKDEEQAVCPVAPVETAQA